MPFFDYECKCGAIVELLVPPGATWRKHTGCGMRMRQLFPLGFTALNTTSPNGERFKHLETPLGRRVESVGEQSKLMDELGCRPAEEYRYHKGGLERQEITEKELGTVLRETNSLGAI